jgi:DNA-binding PadR family transcriptional regulator
VNRSAGSAGEQSGDAYGSVSTDSNSGGANAALKPSAFLILGLIRGGFTSGYAIRRAIDDMRTSAFWATTLAQIYPELARLERGGYISKHDDPQGGRQRSAYALTQRGDEAFDAWLRIADQPPIEVRDEALLRLGFGDYLSRPEALALVRQMRERSEQAEREFREYNIPFAEAAVQQGWHFPLLVARMGAGYHAWAAAFCEQIERELQAADGSTGTEP